MPIIFRGEVAVYQFSTLQTFDALTHGVSTRHGGISPAPWGSLNISHTRGDHPERVAENHRRLYAALEIPTTHVTTAYQVHGADVTRVTAANAGQQHKNTDALITNEPNIPLLLRFADCTPVLLFDPVQRAIGLAHAGWRGTVANVVGATVSAMQTAFGTKPADIVAAIGPSIGPCCYEVGDDVERAVIESFEQPDALFSPGVRGRRHFNLWAANLHHLQAAGVESVEIAKFCTSCHTDWFFSHRAERAECGHFGAIAMLRGEIM